MPKRGRIIFALLFFLTLVVAVLGIQEGVWNPEAIFSLWSGFPKIVPGTVQEDGLNSPDGARPEGVEETGAGPENVYVPRLPQVVVRVPEPEPASAEPPPLLPSPPLPVVPPESTQEERKEAFELRNSVDKILLKDEDLEVEGKPVTISEILGQLHDAKSFQPLIPSIEERDLGGYIKKPIVPVKAPSAQSAYYGVRLVRPAENLWKIHYRIIQEYLARRQIILPPRADEPYPDGRSSGVGRLLKFIEGVVYIYNAGQARLETDRNLIQPHSVLVIFKISDLFEALDQLQPQDIQWLRYVNHRLRLEKPEEGRDLLDSRKLLE